MKKTALTLLGICVLVSTACAQTTLDIPGNRYDFGIVPQNCKISQHFWFKAVGPDTVHIKEVKTGCTCTTMPMERMWIAPGDSMLVGIQWHIERNIGGIGRYPYIMTDVREEPYRIYLTADITTNPDSTYPILSNPHVLLLAKSPIKTIDSLPFRLVNWSDTDVKVRLVSFLPQYVDVSFPDMIKANSEFSSFAKVKPEYADSSFDESVTLLFDDINETRLTIPITRKIYGDAAK